MKAGPDELETPSPTLPPPNDADHMKTIIEGTSIDDPRIFHPTTMEVGRGGKNKRNTFACVGCHSLKQKCVPSDFNDIYRKPCVRCFRQRKKCKFDLSKRTRKRRRGNSNSEREQSTLSSPSGPGSGTPPSLFSQSSNQVPNFNVMTPGIQSSQRKYLTPLGNANLESSLNERLSQNSPVSTSPGILNSALLNPPQNQLDTHLPITTANAPANEISCGNPLLKSDIVDSLNQERGLSVPLNEHDLLNNGTSPSNTNKTALLAPIENTAEPYKAPNNKILQLGRNHNRGISNHHMKHNFKKNLQSLLILLKGKISVISQKFNVWSVEWNKLVENSMFLPTIKDPVSIGIISMDEANIRLDLYRNVVSKQSKLPIVGIEEHLTVNQLRKEKPIFFSVVMSIVSTVMTETQTNRDTVMKLDSFVINLISMQIFKLNNKSIEVVEALVTLCMWYNFLEWSNKTRYHLFNYICCCMTKDLGPTSVNKSFGMFSDEDPYKYKPRIKTPLELAENGPVLILLVYISALNISIFLRQAVNATWNSLTDGAFQTVEKAISKYENGNSNDSNVNLDLEQCKMIILFARLNRLLEKIHINLHESFVMNQENEDIDFSFTVEYIKRLIIKYQNDLNSILTEIPKSRERMLAFYYSVEAYLHQFTLNHYFKNVTDKQNLTSVPENVSIAFVNCYHCCCQSLNEFLKLPNTLISSLPLFHMSRIIYIVGLLILKIRYSVVALPVFHHLTELTDGSIDLVKRVTQKLEAVSELYPYNNTLYKFQYVIALFGQTYANKVTDLAGNVESTDSVTQFNANLLSTPPTMNESTCVSSTDPSASTIGNVDPGVAGVQNSFDPYPISGVSGLQKDGTFRPSDIQNTPPSVSSDNLTDYLTDVNSLAWGYNALNDEFWTDLLYNSI
ncbi:War1p KNAG_0E04100 [Huiozyma naganishii CBS 8797]|uniref:Zn(2)-C6 fungal-type domain-containing protein n=1 Tax=Huiozyma naganishii (strain ATCC MYA-139 / BCRC 22969 / CBS 8797 / KCTC 17520 / NBRC 10181 / NCYC 3082 / Yp74L-3) TaxID=1071383 RepID=J7RM93_HUIN7|nr:hypothetical protein KNAG_0E04100 [Kazachstania naganishii CBS 8797]CCK70663.1 hypothetical protein KNAG_0E04100 [Kazachstania naganishii CBS 8797]